MYLFLTNPFYAFYASVMMGSIILNQSLFCSIRAFALKREERGRFRFHLKWDHFLVCFIRAFALKKKKMDSNWPIIPPDYWLTLRWLLSIIDYWLASSNLLLSPLSSQLGQKREESGGFWYKLETIRIRTILTVFLHSTNFKPFFLFKQRLLYLKISNILVALFCYC